MILYEELDLRKIKVFNLVRVPAIGDGSCFFHSILLGVSEEYSNLSQRGKRIMAANLRRKLAEEFDEGKYRGLSGGELEELSKHLKGTLDLTLGGLKQTLDSRDFVGQELIELVSNELDIDIYIIDLDKEDLYRLGDPKVYIKGRKSVILGYSERASHYDLVGLVEDDDIISLFSPNHEVIIKLKSRFSKK